VRNLHIDYLVSCSTHYRSGLIVRAPLGSACSFGGGSSCWHTRLLACLLFEGGADGDRLVNTPKLLPPATFFCLGSCSSHRCARATVVAAAATSALAVAVAAAAAVAAVGSAACVATAAVIAVAETAAAASHLVVAAAGAWPGLGQSLRFSTQAANHLPLVLLPPWVNWVLAPPTGRGLLSGRSTNSGIGTSGMAVEGRHDKWRCLMPPRVSYVSFAQLLVATNS
jgi:hypothetical protein